MKQVKDEPWGPKTTSNWFHAGCALTRMLVHILGERSSERLLVYLTGVKYFVIHLHFKFNMATVWRLKLGQKVCNLSRISSFNGCLKKL